MTAIAISIALVAGVLGVMKCKSVIDRHTAAVNVLLAKHTHATLAEKDQQRVHERAVGILNRARPGGYREFNNEAEEYGWYALAMAELEISPAIRDYCYPGWNFVRNPYIAILPNDKMFEMVSNYIRSKHGVDVFVGLEVKPVDGVKMSRFG